MLGIDLGTTNSAIAYHNPHTHTTDIIENEFGKRTTPSVVSYIPSTSTSGPLKEPWKVLVGDPAKRQQVLNPKSTFHSTKRLIGKSYKEVVESGELGVHAKHDQMQYEMAPLASGECGVVLNLPKGENPGTGFGTSQVIKSPADVGSKVLKYLLTQARHHFFGQSGGESSFSSSSSSSSSSFSVEKLDKCVITVPAYFNDQQRQATKHAGALAGLKVLRVINEPTAAALAFGMDESTRGAEPSNKDGVIAVYDLGGGTFDVSVLDIEDGVFEVRSTNGDTFLGGDDFDLLLVQFVVDEFVASLPADAKITKETIYGDARLMQRIRDACEQCKIALSHVKETSVDIPFALEGKHHLHVLVTEDQLDAMSMPLITKTLRCVQKAIKDCDLDISKDIDEVLFVGGMTRMPRIRTEVAKLFNNGNDSAFSSARHTTKMNFSINPDESVAIGAAIQGAILSGEIKDILLLDVIPLTLGIETYGGVFAPLVPRNTTIPIKVKEVFSTGVDSQTGVDIKIYQGERTMCINNQLIGDFKLSGIPPMLKGEPQIEVTFEVDADGIINVSARERRSGVAMEISCVSKQLFGMDSTQVKSILQESAANAEMDQQVKTRVELLTKLDIITKDCLKLVNSEYLKPLLEKAGDKKSDVEQEFALLKEQLQSINKEIGHLKECSQSVALVDQLLQYDVDALKDNLMAIQQSLFTSIKQVNDMY